MYALKKPLLEVIDLNIAFNMYEQGLKQRELLTIQSLNLEVFQGEILAVLGSSGSGKSLLAHAILGILPANAHVCGKIKYAGQDLSLDVQKKLRGDKIALIPQSVDFLDPLMRIGKQVIGTKSNSIAQKVIFNRYGLESKVEKMYPHQLSGGMTRRVLIATALAIEPELIVADEPTPGLTLALAKDTLSHFRELADKGTAILLITHDLDLALEVADRIAILYAGTTVEVAKASDFKGKQELLRHPYTKALIDALPQKAFRPIAGHQPYAGKLTQGCPFADRCHMKTEACSQEQTLRELRGGKVFCVNAT